MKKFLPVIIFILFGYNAQPQSETVVFNYDRLHFNNNLPLPYGENFVITGPVSQQVSMVEVQIFDSKAKNNAKPLYQNIWKSNFTTNSESFYIPVNYKLRSTTYDLSINYYREVGQAELQNLNDNLFEALDAYVEQSLILDNNKIKLFKNTQETVDDLNSMVNSSLVYYKNSKDIEFEGFSDVVREKIRIIQDIKKKDAERLYPDLEEDVALLRYREEQVKELRSMLRNEVTFFFNTGLSVLADSRYIDNYPVEKTRNVITIHGGLAGVIFDGDTDDFDSDTGFYAGFSFPLGKKAFSSKFWSNSAFVVGAIIENLEQDNGREISGPIFKRPTYVGLGYKVFEFIRITGGITFLEDEETAGEFDDLTSNAFIRPFIGIQADINLWLDLAK